MAHLEQAYALDSKIPTADEKLPPNGIVVNVNEFDCDCTGPRRRDQTSLRLSDQYGSRAVVISGDTRCNESVIKHGTDADLLMHEVAIVRPELALEPFIQRIMAHHTTAREAATIFERTSRNWRLHAPRLPSEQIPPAPIEELIAEARRTHSGPLEVGADLMSFEIGEIVSVQQRISQSEEC